MVHPLERWFLWFVIYSFIGWVYESILCSVAGKKLVNRGFLNGPVCPIYGTGAVAVVFALSPLRDMPVALFFASAVLTTTLEYLTSWAMEKLFHARWWDYSQRFLNIHGRVCLRGFVAFGAMSVLEVRYVHPRVAALTARLSARATHVLAAALALMFCADLTLTLITVLGLDKRLRAAREAFREQLEERIPRLRGLHAFQMKRLSRAFPSLDFTRYHEEWLRLRERLRHKPLRMDEQKEDGSFR